MRTRTRHLNILLAVVSFGAGMVLPTGRVAGAVAPEGFGIFFKVTGEGITLGNYRFESPPWQFGDRPGYRCAWAFLIDDGEPIARVQFDRGATYTTVNDDKGPEAPGEDFSQCIAEKQREVKSEPAGLGDTIVSFVHDGETLASLDFPATSPTDDESWWELERADSDSVEIELYWIDEVAVIATLTSLSPSLTLSTRTSEPPSVNSFSPVGGGIGTQVSIGGANFIGVTSVTFGGVPAAFQTESGSALVATVPPGAESGPISVTSPAGTGSSKGDFTVPVEARSHPSKVTISLRRALVAKGSVVVDGGPAGCVADRTVVVQRRVSGRWKWAGKDTTGTAGRYRAELRDRRGFYRAKVKQKVLAPGDTCLRDFSGKRFNTKSNG